MDRYDTIPMTPEQQSKMDKLAARGLVKQVQSMGGMALLLGLVCWIFNPFLLVGMAGMGASMGCVALVVFMGSGVRRHVAKGMILLYLAVAVFGGLLAALRTALGLLVMSG
ncbi:MAG: hypothetical protein JRI25_13565 [Deltaproteobacteria bacterium]|nr:hypothetical protein [Deltaproteobacteria bacterium]